MGANMKRMRLVFVLILGLPCIGELFAAEATSSLFVRSDTPFVLIADTNAQATEWATCAAIYQLVAESLATDPKTANQAEQIRQQGNGAKLAITMSFVADAFSDMQSPPSDGDLARFNAGLEYGKVAMTALPPTQMTAILADLERTKLLNDNIDAWQEKLLNSFKVCLSNGEGQQSYVDLWRELATSGLISFK